MSVDMDYMKKLQAELDGERSSDSDVSYWKDKEGKHTIRFLLPEDDIPIRKYSFHYGVGKRNFICPRNQFGDDCPICTYASSLWKQAKEENDKNLEDAAKKLFSKDRYYSPILVREKPQDGVMVYSYGIRVARNLLTMVNDPDYSEMFDTQAGYDMMHNYEYAEPGNIRSAQTTITLKPKPCAVADSDEELTKIRESIPDMSDLFSASPKEEMVEALQRMIGNVADSPDKEVDFGSSEDDDVNSADLGDVINKLRSQNAG